jgi:hypothetical protein
MNACFGFHAAFVFYSTSVYKIPFLPFPAVGPTAFFSVCTGKNNIFR